MNFSSLLGFFLVACFAGLLDAASFDEGLLTDGDFVLITGLTKQTCYNGLVGVVNNAKNRADERSTVTVFLATTEQFESAEPVSPSVAFKDLLVRRRNVVKISQRDWAVHCRPQYCAPAVQDRIKRFICALCDNDGNKFITDKELYLKIRVIGAWIYFNYGHTGMVRICDHVPSGCSLARGTNRAIESSWNYIGEFLG